MESNVIDELIIFGAGGHAITVSEVAIINSPDIKITFVGESPEERIFNFPVASEIKNSKGKKFIVGIGNNTLRKSVYVECLRCGMIPVSIISKQAYIGLESKIGKGSFIANRCVIGAMSEMGENCILNAGSQLSHEVVLSSHSQLGPLSIAGGKTKIGSEVFIGIGGVVIDRISICNDVIIGANSTVIKDIDKPGTYVGSPVRKVK